MNFRSVVGIVLILVGAVLFLNQGETFNTARVFELFWPVMFIIPVGLLFHWMYFSLIGRGVGLLVPGGVILTVGIVCQISVLFNAWEYMWPGFILAPAVGLLELYWFGGRNKWLLIPINILLVLSLLFFVVFSIGSVLNRLLAQPIIAIALILLGAFTLLVRRKEF